MNKGRGVVAELGLRMKPLDVPIGLAIGVAAQLLLVPVLYWLLFRTIGTRDVSAVARQLTDRATNPLAVVLVYVIVGIGAPIAEEIYFRGFAQRVFGRRIRPQWAVLASAAFFAASATSSRCSSPPCWCSAWSSAGWPSATGSPRPVHLGPPGLQRHRGHGPALRHRLVSGLPRAVGRARR